MTRPSILPTLAAISLFVCATGASATERHFAFTYETLTLPKGAFEYEQQVFWERGDTADAIKFREELEYGVTDHLQLALYLYDLEYTRESGDHDTRWAGSGIEAIYQLSDPNTDLLGSALYAEAIRSDDTFSLEGKLLLQKNVGPVILAYNAILEAEWENDFQDKVGVLEQKAGVSYQLHPSFSVGLEAKHEVELEDWMRSTGNAVFVGPNVSFRHGHFFLAATCLLRVSDMPEEPFLELGTVGGYHF